MQRPWRSLRVGRLIFKDGSLIITVQNLGKIGYQECLDLQRKLHSDLAAGSTDQTLLICSHDPVLTCGSSTESAHFLVPRNNLDIPVFDIERGGSVTYHGPEQIIAYPILNLNLLRRDVGWYMRSLEEILIRTLADYGVSGSRDSGRTGVWIQDAAPPAKIAFMGVRLSRWFSFHGISLNLEPCADRFKDIVPCGLESIRVTSLREETSTEFSRGDVEKTLVSKFLSLFTASNL